MAGKQREPHLTMDEDVTVGDVQPLDGPVTLVEYDPAWPERYAALAHRIRKALGEVVVLVEHVGSTSAPGLVAKPIIDIVLVLSDSANEGSYVAALEAEGYALHIREPDWYEHRVLKGGDTDVNLHVFSACCPEIDRMLLFRDRLRAEPAERDRYAAVKRQLAAQHKEVVTHPVAATAGPRSYKAGAWSSWWLGVALGAVPGHVTQTTEIVVRTDRAGAAHELTDELPVARINFLREIDDLDVVGGGVRAPRCPNPAGRPVVRGPRRDRATSG